MTALSPSLHVQAERRLDPGLGASLFDASEDCVKIIDLDGRLLAMNANGICLMEIDDFEALRGAPWHSLWPPEHRAAIESALAEGVAGRGSKFVADCPTARGALKSWEVVVWPVMGADGKPERLVSISRDITERLRVERDNALLTRELAHRIKNMFAVVDGVVALSARAAGEARPFVDGLRQRLAGLGRAIAFVAPEDQRDLSSQTARDLHALLRMVLEPYGSTVGDGAQIAITGQDTPVGHGAITPLALVVNELATNAMKYGALRTPEGCIRVKTTVAGDTVQLSWEERGEPGKTMIPGTGRGFGSVLLENAVIRQLGGSLERSWTAEGLIVEISAPLPRISG